MSQTSSPVALRTPEYLSGYTFGRDLGRKLRPKAIIEKLGACWGKFPETSQGYADHLLGHIDGLTDALIARMPEGSSGPLVD